jgi:hypothetical protein
MAWCLITDNFTIINSKNKASLLWSGREYYIASDRLRPHPVCRQQKFNCIILQRIIFRCIKPRPLAMLRLPHSQSSDRYSEGRQRKEEGLTVLFFHSRTFIKFLATDASKLIHTNLLSLLILSLDCLCWKMRFQF